MTDAPGQRQRAEYCGPAADERAARIREAIGTDAETLADAVWLLRYITVKHGIEWPTLEELEDMRR